MIRILIKSFRNPAYLQRIGERFGFFSSSIGSQGGLWVHSVSVGETLAVVPLIQQLRRVYPDMPITVTTMSPTGSDCVKERLGDTVFHVYAPYDLPFALNEFFTKVKPICALIIETEIWPNLLYGCRKRGIPVVLANARLSKRSAARYASFPNFTRGLLDQLTLIAAQSRNDAERFLQLGALPNRVRVINNIKYDQSIPADVHEKAAVFTAMWSGRKVWLAASTHEGEEALILEAFAAVKRQMPEVLLFLVPRHPERFTKVEALCRKKGFVVQRRSLNAQHCPVHVDVFLGDSMGELQTFYAAADLAYVGGSLVPVGGHNMLEPAALGVAIITGPHIFNFAEIAGLLMATGGLIKVENVTELGTKVVELLADESLCSTISANALAAVIENRGSISQYVTLIGELCQQKAT